MDLTQEQFEELIGAYALDACDPEEVAALDAYADAHPQAAADLERLRAAAATIGAAGALRPPVDLRNRLVSIMNDRVAPASARATLVAETARFDELLATISESDLDTVTHNGLRVHELVAHIEAIDRVFVLEADAPRRAYIGPDDVAAITHEDLPVHAGEAFADTVERYRRTRASLIGLADRVSADTRLAGFTRDDTLVVRAFETWTHHDDIRRALGRDEIVPAPEVMRAMAELSMASLPLAMVVRGREAAATGRTARLVLTGAGGGEWTIACAPGEQPGSTADVVIRTSVVDWCRRFADRIEPDELPLQTDGDADLARELVTVANAFAGL
jgi:uncharacterized protein (TIGR03083 family)